MKVGDEVQAFDTYYYEAKIIEIGFVTFEETPVLWNQAKKEMTTLLLNKEKKKKPILFYFKN